MRAFKYLIKVFDAVSYRACATSSHAGRSERE
jgi:hypothetical protein